VSWQRDGGGCGHTAGPRRTDYHSSVAPPITREAIKSLNAMHSVANCRILLQGAVLGAVNLDFLVVSPLFAGKSIVPCVRNGEAYTTPELEAAIRALRLNRRKNLQDDMDLRKPRSSFRCQASENGTAAHHHRARPRAAQALTTASHKHSSRTTNERSSPAAQNTVARRSARPCTERGFSPRFVGSCAS
jgi:hypothetical protein